MLAPKLVSMIDKSITEKLVSGCPINEIQRYLFHRARIIHEKIQNENPSMTMIVIMKMGDPKIKDTLFKNRLFYVKHCYKRIGDLYWVSCNKDKFKNLSINKIFELKKFRNDMCEKACFHLPF